MKHNARPIIRPTGATIKFVGRRERESLDVAAIIVHHIDASTVTLRLKNDFRGGEGWNAQQQGAQGYGPLTVQQCHGQTPLFWLVFKYHAASELTGICLIRSPCVDIYRVGGLHGVLSPHFSDFTINNPNPHLLFGGATLDDVGQPQLVACKAIYFSVVFTLKKWFLFNGTFGIIGAMEHTETPNGATTPIELPDRVWEKIFPVLSGNYWLNHKLT